MPTCASAANSKTSIRELNRQREARVIRQAIELGRQFRGTEQPGGIDTILFRMAGFSTGEVEGLLSRLEEMS